MFIKDPTERIEINSKIRICALTVMTERQPTNRNRKRSRSRSPAADPPAKRARLAQRARMLLQTTEEALRQAQIDVSSLDRGHRDAVQLVERAVGRLQSAELTMLTPGRKQPEKVVSELSKARKFLVRNEAALAAAEPPLASARAALATAQEKEAAARAAADAAAAIAGDDLQPWAWDCPVLQDPSAADEGAWRAQLAVCLRIRHFDPNVSAGHPARYKESWERHTLALAVDPTQLHTKDRGPLRLLAELGAQATQTAVGGALADTPTEIKVPVAAPAPADLGSLQALLRALQATQEWDSPAAHPGVFRMPEWRTLPGLSFQS